MRHALGAILLLAVGSANAMPVEWTFNNVIYGDGSITTGSFTYDEDSNIYDWTNVTTICGSVCSGEFSGPLANIGVTSSQDFEHFGSTTGGTIVINRFGWDAPLTNLGGTISLYAYIDPQSGGSTNTSSAPAFIIASVVPIPAAVWLFGSALMGLGFFRRSKS